MQTLSPPREASPFPAKASSEAVPANGRISGRKMMEAAVVTAPGQVHFQNVPIPQPKQGEVRVRLEGCGVCGSNLAPWEGRPWFQYPFGPGELGHEGWGHIDEVGAGVTNVRIGDRVAMLSYHAYAEYDLAPESCVVPLPHELDDQPFPGEALGCAMNVFRRSGICSGQTVAIIGIGFLGAMITALCANAGARLIAISRRSFSLETARQMGATELIPLDDHSQIIETVKSLTSGNFCDCVIEATGLQWPLDLAGELTRERGRLVVAGYHQDGPRQVNMQLWNWRGLDIINAHERDPRVYLSGIRATAEAVATGAIDPSPLYTHRFPLSRLADAFNAMKNRPENFLKALIIT